MIQTYSQTGDALYLRLKQGRSVASDEIDNGTLVDLDESGDVVGIEVLNPGRDWPLEQILERYELDIADVLALRTLHGGSGNSVRAFANSSITAGTTTTMEVVLS